MVVVKRRSERVAAPQFTRADVEALSNDNSEPQWLAESRLAAWELYETMPMPTLQDEAWRRTDYSHVKWEQASKKVDASGASIDLVPAESLEPLVGEEKGALMVFVDGVLVEYDVPQELTDKGVIFKDLRTAADEDKDLVKSNLMTQAVKPDEGKFAALHAALWNFGWFVHVPENVIAETPMHVVVYNSKPGVQMGHSLVVVEENAQATVIVDYTSADGDEQFGFIGATELLTGDAANLQYVALQDWNRNTYEFNHQRARVGKQGNLDWIIGLFGTQLSKNFIEMELDGTGANGRVSGFFFADDDQLFDLDTQQNHNAPATNSDLLFKGAGKDVARTVWQGMIKSLPKMQKIDGFQASRNLLLSDTVRMDGIPGLEIEADDVACSHAATFGSLEEEPIHYLMSRGIPRNQAELMLIEGFFDELLQRVPFERVVERLQDSVQAKILS
ncbi:MAG: Fe-S cluster assembly protein SufD [Chloroflexota bacterium]